MFLSGFLKTATTLVTMTPEEYYDIVREKDPFVGAVTGSLVGGAVGGIKGKHGAKSILTGAAVGAGTGAVSSHLGGKLLRRHQANKVRRMAEELNLKSTPGRRNGS